MKAGKFVFSLSTAVFSVVLVAIVVLGLLG